MRERAFLGEFELLVMLAVLRLADTAYAVTIRQDIEARTGRKLARGAVYVTLDRLGRKGFLASALADPTPERGGRGKRYYTVTAAGRQTVRDTRAALSEMWSGLDAAIEDPNG
jgi:DNA-binding PadR family transcriptional regulator